jgi:hypothetical protein
MCTRPTVQVVSRSAFVRRGCVVRPLSSGVRGLMTQAHLQLSTNSRRALRGYHVLKTIAGGALAVGLSDNWWSGAPKWTWELSMVTAAISGGCAVLLSRRVRCPYCEHAALESFAPSWRKILPFERQGLLRCEYCQETIDCSGGASPPSSISLHRP